MTNSDLRVSTAVDLWAAGVVMAILMNDCSHPYIEKGESEKFIKAKIVNNDLNLDRIKGSQTALDLLRKLLDPNPTTRIKASEAMAHPWFLRKRAFGFSEVFKSSEKDLTSTKSQVSQPTGIPTLSISEGPFKKTSKQIVVCLHALIMIATSRKVINNRPLKLWMLKDRASNRPQVIIPQRSPETSPPIRSRQPIAYSKEPIIHLDSRRPVYAQGCVNLAGSLLNLSNELEGINLDANSIKISKRPAINSKLSQGRSKNGLLTSNEFCRNSGSMLRTVDDRPRESGRDVFRVVSRGVSGMHQGRERQPVKPRPRGDASFDLVKRENYISSTYDETNKHNNRAKVGKMLQSLTKTQDLESLKWRTPSKEQNKQSFLVGSNKTFDHLEAYFKTDYKGDVFSGARKTSTGFKQDKKVLFAPNMTIRKQKLNIFSQKPKPG